MAAPFATPSFMKLESDLTQQVHDNNLFFGGLMNGSTGANGWIGRVMIVCGHVFSFTFDTVHTNLEQRITPQFQ